VFESELGLSSKLRHFLKATLQREEHLQCPLCCWDSSGTNLSTAYSSENHLEHSMSHSSYTKMDTPRGLRPTTDLCRSSMWQYLTRSSLLPKARIVLQTDRKLVAGDIEGQRLRIADLRVAIKSVESVANANLHVVLLWGLRHRSCCSQLPGCVRVS